jgi:hypothetical protein
MSVFHNCTNAGLLENAQNTLRAPVLQISAHDFRNQVWRKVG